MKRFKVSILLTAILSAFAIILTGCGGGGGGDGGGGPSDTTAPTVSSTSPANNATGVAINTAITVTFSEAMTASTITTATFTVGGVTGTVTYDAVNKIATFTPTSNLASSTPYTATITTGVKDAAGNAMATNYTWTFTTGTAAGTGTRTASGTYTWNSTTGVLTFNWTSSDFTCDGPDLGTETKTGVTITATTMTLPNSGAVTGTDMVFTRSSGTAGDIVGTWTSTESTTGNSYTLTSNANGTLSFVGVIVQCSSDGGNPSASSQHWSNGCYVSLQYNDSPKTASSVSVTGQGITGSKSLTYSTSAGSWNSWTSPSTQVDFGTTCPTGLPFTYTFSITDTTTWTATSIVSCFQERFATNLSPTGTVTATPTFSWTGIGDSSATYRVELNDSNYNRIWQSDKISGTSIVYGGPTLTSGATYKYDVVVTSSSDCSNQLSFASGSFTYQSSSNICTEYPTAGKCGTVSGGIEWVGTWYPKQCSCPSGTIDQGGSYDNLLCGLSGSGYDCKYCGCP